MADWFVMFTVVPFLTLGIPLLGSFDRFLDRNSDAANRFKAKSCRCCGGNRLRNVRIHKVQKI